jgi:hypothetical protein
VNWRDEDYEEQRRGQQWERKDERLRVYVEFGWQFVL